MTNSDATPEDPCKNRLPRVVLERIQQVLVIDDDAFVCKVIASQIQSLGIAQVTTTLGDAETVHLLNEGGPYDLILSDLSMPKFDGIQLMRLVAVRQKSAAVLFVSASGHKLISAARELAANHGLHVLPGLEKPTNRQNLYDSLLSLATEAPHAKAARTQMPLPKLDELKSAITAFQIEVYVQPQMYASTGKLYGVEALARWNHPRLGFVSPDIFVRMAEEHDLVDELTELVLKKSLLECSMWKQAGLETRISVNSPVSSMSNLMLPDTIVAMIERYKLSPNQLTIEITETGIINNQDRALDVLARLRLRGIGLAIDDFGCGHSTFKQIRRMPFNELKIDSSFVMNMFTDRDACSIVRSSLDLARELDMHAVAEGVETLEHWQSLAEMHCDILQGFYIAKPFPARQLPDWLARFRPPQFAAMSPDHITANLDAY